MRRIMRQYSPIILPLGTNLSKKTLLINTIYRATTTFADLDQQSMFESGEGISLESRIPRTG